jgi:hypothetical protein
LQTEFYMMSAACITNLNFDCSEWLKLQQTSSTDLASTVLWVFQGPEEEPTVCITPEAEGTSAALSTAQQRNKKVSETITSRYVLSLINKAQEIKTAICC